MANIFVNIPVPAANGSGAPVAMGAFGSSKTISVTGPFVGAVSIEVTNEIIPTTWAPIVTFNNADGIVFDVACRWMRATVAGYKSGIPTCDVGGTDDGTLFALLPATVGDGAGAAVSTALLGLFKTVTVGGPFLGSVQVEMSEDGVGRWSQLGFSFTNPGQQTMVAAANFMRVVRDGVPLVNPGLPIVDVGGCTVSGGAVGPPGPAGASSPNCLIYRPGSGLAGPVVFDSWPVLYAELLTQRAASNGSGCYTIDFDDSIVSPAPIPAGAYDMTMVEWSGGLGADPAIAVAEGATFTNLRTLARAVQVDFTGVTPPIADFVVGDNFYIGFGARVSSSGTGPLILNSAAGVVFVLDRGASLLTGAFPVLETAVGAQSLVVAVTAFAEVQDNSLSGPVGAVAVVLTGASGIALVSETHTSFLGTLIPQNQTKARLNPNPTPPSGPITGDFTVDSANQIVLVDPSGLFPVPGQLVITLPLAAGPSPNRGQHVIIKNVSALPGVITIIPQGADTVDGVLLVAFNVPMGAICFVSDGVSTWRQAPTSLYAPPEQWAQENVAPSQTGVALSCQVSTNFDDLRMIRPGSIVGLGVRFTEALTAGTATIRATINGGNAAIEVTCTSLSNADGGQMTTQSGVDVYSGGSIIGVEIDTDAGITFANPSNVEVWLEVTEFGDPLLA